MKFERTKRFKKSYRQLSKDDKEKVAKALSFLQQNPSHPSLRVKKVQGTANIYEARASDSIRFTFQIESDTCILRVVGRHDDVLRQP